MARTRVSRTPEFREVIYSEEHWRLLRELREKAQRIMEVFASNNIEAWLHGSVARGDVKKTSDVDIVLPRKVPGYLIEHLLERAGFKPYARYLVAATPTSTIKAYIMLDEEERISVNFPLTDFKPIELEFYKFGGYITYNELLEDKRVPGVNKNLVLIIPTPMGHKELPVIGYESYVAEFLGVSIEVVLERVEVLTRRDEVGRTGIYAKLALAPDEGIEEGLRRLLRERPLLRKIHADSL
ncbi:MAG: nucleotidyltransferase domain-containing protein [Desulfurococcaceae archaeon]